MKRESRSAKPRGCSQCGKWPALEMTSMRAPGISAAPGLAIGGADDAVLLAPQQQRRDVDAMQPALQMRVVHVRLPAEPRERLAAARDAGKFGLRQLHQVALAVRRIGPGEAHVLVARHRVHVGDVAVGHAADLDAERIDQHQPAEAPRVAHRHLGGDPAAEAGADQDGVLQPQRRGEIEIQVGEVIDRAQPVRQRRIAPARMMRRNHPIALRQQVEPFAPRLQSLAGDAGTAAAVRRRAPPVPKRRRRR